MPKSKSKMMKALYDKNIADGLALYRQWMTPKHRVSMKAVYTALDSGATVTLQDGEYYEVIQKAETIDVYSEPLVKGLKTKEG